jgi:hypothetical protein
MFTQGKEEGGRMQADHNGVKKSMLALLCSCFSSSKTDD